MTFARNLQFAVYQPATRQSTVTCKQTLWLCIKCAFVC